jgi:hypothetical protein
MPALQIPAMFIGNFLFHIRKLEHYLGNQFLIPFNAKLIEAAKFWENKNLNTIL